MVMEVMMQSSVPINNSQKERVKCIPSPWNGAQALRAGDSLIIHTDP